MSGRQIDTNLKKYRNLKNLIEIVFQKLDLYKFIHVCCPLLLIFRKAVIT